MQRRIICTAAIGSNVTVDGNFRSENEIALYFIGVRLFAEIIAAEEIHITYENNLNLICDKIYTYSITFPTFWHAGLSFTGNSVKVDLDWSQNYYDTKILMLIEGANMWNIYTNIYHGILSVYEIDEICCPHLSSLLTNDGDIITQRIQALAADKMDLWNYKSKATITQLKYVACLQYVSTNKLIISG